MERGTNQTTVLLPLRESKTVRSHLSFFSNPSSPAAHLLSSSFPSAKRAQREMDHTKLGSKFIYVMFSKRDQLAPKAKRHREQDEQRPEWTSSTRRRLSEEDLESYHKGGSSSKGEQGSFSELRPAVTDSCFSTSTGKMRGW